MTEADETSVDTVVRDVRQRLTGESFVAEVLLSQLNARVQVTSYRARNPAALASVLEQRAHDAGFDKVFVKARQSDRGGFESGGMQAEAVIEGYYAGEPAVVMSRFLSESRAQPVATPEQEAILAEIQKRPADPSLPPLPAGYGLVRAELRDSSDLAQLYGSVFRSYPFPIDDPAYVAATLGANVCYRLVRQGDGTIVAAASAETDAAHANAEMTDFATRPEQRGLGLAQHLLAALERDMEEAGIPNLYTIARARSAGMNRVFYNRGYRRTGTLVNNCHIAGRFEDMHVWCKQLAGTAARGSGGMETYPFSGVE